MDTFPYIRKPSRSDWVAVDSSEVARDIVQGWKDFVVSADCLKFVQTSSGNIISDRGYIKDLQTLVRQLE